MPCCGSGGTRSSRPATPHEASGAAARPAPVEFVYVGDKTLNVIGGATGRQYRFVGYASRLLVDRRDAPGFALVPHLRAVAP